MAEATDLLARFVLAGTTIVVASEWLMPHSSWARRFFISPLWPALRYAAMIAAIILCAIVLRESGS